MSNKKKGSLEKVYTPNKLTDFLVDIIKDKCDFNITEILEPSAGSGQMIDRLQHHYPDTNILAYDIFNETEREDITEADFLKLNKKKIKDLEYKSGRITVMNPPFSKGLKFIYKSLEVSDMVFCITSSNSFMNLDYDKYILEELYFIKKAYFSNGNAYGINMMAIKKKEEIDEFWN